MASASIHSIRVGKRFPLGLEFMRILAVAISIGQDMERDNVRVHRVAANSLNIETRATRGSVCNALLSAVRGSNSCESFDCMVKFLFVIVVVRMLFHQRQNSDQRICLL